MGADQKPIGVFLFYNDIIKLYAIHVFIII